MYTWNEKVGLLTNVQSTLSYIEDGVPESLLDVHGIDGASSVYDEVRIAIARLKNN